MISRVAVLPQPPLLVPQLLGAAPAGGRPEDRELGAVRAACLAAAADLAACSPTWTAVGAGAGTATGVGTFAPYGVDVRVTLRDHEPDGADPGSADPGSADPDGADPDPGWSLPALIAGWLRGQAGAREVDLRAVDPDLDPAGCAARGAELVGATALLVLGDGSHRHGERSVGRPDDRAADFDARVSAALAAADPGALLALDPVEAAELGAVGRAPWQVLAGAVLADGRRWRARTAATYVPFGVAYHVAVWEPV